MGKEVRLIYSGKTIIQKKNLVIMIEELQIPIEYVAELKPAELLLLTDCQYGEGNVTKHLANQVAMIDHHEVCVMENDFTEIRSNYGSCATVVYSMLLNEGFPINSDLKLSTALYYGLYMDTNGFGEIKHPIDLDMMEDLRIIEYLISRLKSSNFTANEIALAGSAMQNYIYVEKERYAIVKTDPCDPNILGFISDMILQVDTIDVCVVYNELDYGYKLSVRSCRRDVTANELARYLTDNIGNGGGHKRRAGGYVKASKFKEAYLKDDFGAYISERMSQYFTSYDIIDTVIHTIATEGMRTYKKLPIKIGFAKTLDFAAAGTVLVARTLEGDVTITADPDIYVMIGIDQEVYPVKRRTFESNYLVSEDAYLIKTEYNPTVRNKRSDEVYSLCDYAKICVSMGESYIFAKQIRKTTKVFTKWNYDDYMLGMPGDYLAIRDDGNNEAYIIKKEIMEKTYQLVQ